ncbi:MAG: hypothetical protein K2X93_28550 [Candidatus Obscuribacterales bacterium]|nr:hypothetical protein [Candidatus Obscuribacterales bacterium]
MLYYEPVPETEETLELMRLIDEQYTATRFFGARREGLVGYSQANPKAHAENGTGSHLSQAKDE